MTQNLQVRVFKMSNGMDIIGQFISDPDYSEDTVFISDLNLPVVFSLKAPRALLLREAPKKFDPDTGKEIPAHVKVGLAPINLEDPQDLEPIPFMRSHVMSVYSIPDDSALLKSYFASLEGDKAKEPSVQPKTGKATGSSGFGGKSFVAG